MELSKNAITVWINIEQPVEKVWEAWTNATDIMQWNNPTDEWHSPKVLIDFRTGGNFLFRMETKDGKVGFDHAGKYDSIILLELIEYTESSGRRSVIKFQADGPSTLLTETFEPEPSISFNEQEKFCDGVLINFKKYVELKYGQLNNE